VSEIEDVIQPCLRKGMVSLADAAPEIAVHWCFDQNCGWRPEDFGYGSRVKAWWVCSICSRPFQTNPSSRTAKNGAGCPYCQHKLPTEENNVGRVVSRAGA
jgi:DNA-directed RNA polymerase subunit RPC12/RpoP